MSLLAKIPSAKNALRLALSVLALSLAPFASATELFKGTIDLPVDARWNDAVLKAGAYAVSIESDAAGLQYIHIRNRQGDQIMIAGPANYKQPYIGGRITMVNAGGTHVVKQFDAGSVGESFSFQTPKGLAKEHDRAAAKTTVQIVASR